MAGKTSQGTLLQRESSLGSASFTTIANCKSWSGPSTENAEIDVTSLTSTGKEFIPGLIDYGDLTLELLFDPNNATHQQLFTDAEASPPTVTGWRIQFVTPTINFYWSAFVKSFSISGEVDGAITGSLTLRLSGARVVSY